MQAQPTDFELWLTEHRGAYLLFGLIGLLSVTLSVALLLAPVQVVIGLGAVLVFLMLTLFQPFLGLIAYLMVEYLQPGAVYPALEAFRIQRVMALAVVVSLLLHRLLRHRHGADYRSAALAVPSPRPVSAGGPASAAKRVRLSLVAADWLLISFLALMFVEVATSYWRSAALSFTAGFAKTVVVYFLMRALLNSGNRVRAFMWTLVLVCGFLAVGQFRSYLAGDVGAGRGREVVARLGSETPFMTDSNDFAVGMVIALGLTVFLVVAERGWWRLVAALLVPVFIASVVATGSRGGALAMAAVLAIAWVKLPRKVVGLAVISCLLAGWWLLAPPAYRVRMSTITEGSTDPATMVRLNAWAAARQMIRDHPITGVGPGDFPAAYAEKYGNLLDPTRGWHTAHSLYYQVTAEMGLPGVLLLLAMVVALFRANRRTRRASPPQGEARWAFFAAHGLDVALVGLMISGLFLSLTYYPHLYWMLGMAVSLSQSVAPPGES